MWNLKKTKPKNPKWIKTKNLLDTQIIAWKLPQGKGVNTCEAGDYCRGYQCWSIKLKTRNLEKESVAFSCSLRKICCPNPAKGNLTESG